MRAPEYAPDPAALLALEVVEDPHAFFATLRRERPLSRIGDTGIHLASSWRLVEEALSREADFSAHLTGVLMRGSDGRPTSFALPATGATAVIATADEPEHAVHRALVQPRLRRVEGLEEPIRRWTRELLEPWLRDGGGDFVPIAERVPARVVARVLGLPQDDVERFRSWAMMGGDMLAGDVDPARMSQLGAETARMAEYLGRHLDAAQDAQDAEGDGPETSLLEALARGVRSGEIGRDTAIGIAIVMFGAGGESTSALIGSAIRLLALDPALADRLRASPQEIPRFVEETVRLEPPFKLHYRSVRRACALGGFDLEPGDRLMLVWASANRDAEIFEDPDSLRLDRRYPKSHLGFGRGTHFCVGAPLARLQARVVVEEVLEQTRAFELRRDSRPVHAASVFVRRLERLPLDVEPAR